MKVPENIKLCDAGGIPETFLTAFQLLNWIGDPTKNGVLIHGAGSGVGTSAIQLAADDGKTVFATAGSDAKCEKAIALGAKRAINYKTQDFGAEFKSDGIGNIIDCVGAAFWKQNIKVLDQDGVWVLYGLLGGVKIEGALLALLLAKRAQIRASTLMSRSDEYKSQLVEQFWRSKREKFENGRLAPVIDSVFDMSRIADAHAYLATNQNCGKVLLRMDL